MVGGREDNEEIIFSYKLQTTNYKLQTTNYKLQTTNYKLQTNYNRLSKKSTYFKYNLHFNKRRY
ncbi:MAG: hypothetical protein RBR07_03260 [Arcobacteraceae bacterium]|nr:hypothetical protein [Arcobacteraceae bacterium]